MLRSENTKVNYIALKSLNNSVGVLGQNRLFLTLKYDIRNIEQDCHLPLLNSDNTDLMTRVQQIKELISAREGTIRIEVFGYDINQALEFLCTY